MSLKVANLLRSASHIAIFPKNVIQALIMKFFSEKSENFELVEKNRKYDDESVFSNKKRFHLLKMHLLPNWEGAKYAGGRRLSCYLLKSISIYSAWLRHAYRKRTVILWTTFFVILQPNPLLIFLKLFLDMSNDKLSQWLFNGNVLQFSFVWTPESPGHISSNGFGCLYCWGLRKNGRTTTGP